MADIIIHGVEMPKNCFHCWLGRSCAKYKPLLWNEIGQERKHDCPLTIVQGSLISRDSLLKRIDMHGTNKFGMLDEDIRKFINEEPVVIKGD